MGRLSHKTVYDLGFAAGRTEGHRFDAKDVSAIEAALLTGRPLLLKGEPGVGKSQIAKAAAIGLGRGFRSKTVDHATEARDLLWEEDLIERLAEAQAIGASLDLHSKGVGEADGPKNLSDIRLLMDIRRFVRPGVLWWGFDPGSAMRHYKDFVGQEIDAPASYQDGMVVLIDEIDKAESDVPNGLLEALGARRFQPRGYETFIEGHLNPLVLITTNQERPLPPAFMRRCIVHDIRLPDGQQLEELLKMRATAHFSNLKDADLDCVSRAARMVSQDRERARQLGLRPLPGQAEFFDLLNAMFSDDPLAARTPAQTLDELGSYIVRKHSELNE